MPTLQAKHWVFTLNNYTPEDIDFLTNGKDSFSYLVFGREVGENGTPHLQGYCCFPTRLRFNNAKLLINQRAHLEVSRGTPKQASDYCKKDENFEEYGTLPGGQGKRSEWERLTDWLKELDEPPTDAELWAHHPSLYGRYQEGVKRAIDAICPHPTFDTGVRRPWQRELELQLEQPPDDRRIFFVVDPIGGTGKSWFIRYMVSEHPDTVQRLSVGKRDDIAYSINVERSIFLFDVPRGTLEHFQYSVLEQLKDQMIFSPKYQSCSKILRHKCHVVVFTNEEPDYNKLTGDRYNVIRPQQENDNPAVYLN